MTVYTVHMTVAFTTHDACTVLDMLAIEGERLLLLLLCFMHVLYKASGGPPKRWPRECASVYACIVMICSSSSD